MLHNLHAYTKSGPFKSKYNINFLGSIWSLKGLTTWSSEMSGEKCEVWFNGFGSRTCLQLMLGIVGIWKINKLGFWICEGPLFILKLPQVKHDTSEIYRWNMYSEVCNYRTFQSEERQLLV